MESTAKSHGGISKRTSSGSGPDNAGRRARGGVRNTKTRANALRRLSHEDIASQANGKPAATKQTPVDINITGWTECKKLPGQDNIIPSLISWIERKATLKSPTRRPVKVKSHRINDQTLIISINPGDVGAVVRLNMFLFANANLKIVRASEDITTHATQDTIEMLERVLKRRYNPELKLLDLSALGQDPDLQASTIFESQSTTSKFFPALMKVLERQFDTLVQKREAIQSVTLANNDLPDLSVVTTLSFAIPHLKNLDLSNNKFAKIGDIDVWRKRFLHLDHYVISNNPIEQAEPDLAKTITSWYPHLRLYNAVRVRTDEEAANGRITTKLPFPNRPPTFKDEGQVGENFIRTFFPGYDTDRAALARMYYDKDSDFSLSVDARGRRDPDSVNHPAPEHWDAYLKNSRNMRKITHGNPRQLRLRKGVDSIVELWNHLPVSRHPDLAESEKWFIECITLPGLPDLAKKGSSVNGLLITVHGQFDEIDVSTGQVQRKRSFDRSITLGPGGTTGVRVVNDVLVIRPYAGTEGFATQKVEQTTTNNAGPALPPGLTPEVAQQMVQALQTQTGMTIAYAKDCLEQVTWDFDRALQAFAAVKETLPAAAFEQPQAVAAAS